MNEITFEIQKHIGVIAEFKNGWNKEVNILSWNEGTPKFDIRDWDPYHECMTRGITLYEEEAKKLMEVLQDYFKEV